MQIKIGLLQGEGELRVSQAACKVKHVKLPKRGEKRGGGRFSGNKKREEETEQGRGKGRQNEVRGFVRPVVGGSNKAC